VSAGHGDLARELARAKAVVPHYYLSIEVSVDKLLKLQAELNGKDGAALATPISVQDLLIKAAAVAVKQVK